MYAHREAGLVYLAMPRTGSRTTARTLFRAGFVSVSADRTQRTTERAAGWHHEGWGDQRPAWVRSVATTIRHPAELVVSFWEHRNRPKPLVDWLRDGLHEDHRLYFPQPDRVYGLHLPHADTVFRLDTLGTDLARWLTGHGLEMPELAPREGGSRRQHPGWEDYFGPAERQAFLDRYGDEMRELGYEMIGQRLACSQQKG